MVDKTTPISRIRRVSDWTILHEHDGLIVIDKPPGLCTSGKTLEDPDCLQYELMQRYRRKIWVVHQLDKSTSGVNLCVRRKALVAHWQEQLRRGKKTYVALVHGVPSWTRRRLDEPMGFVEDRGSHWIKPDGRSAVSHVHVVDAVDDFALVTVRIETGRTHQVRIHLSNAGHPLVGEPWYREAACELHPRHALHAWRVEAGGETFTAPVPPDLVALAARLGLNLRPSGPVIAD